MSVNYESVMIFGFKISEKEITRFKEDVGVYAWRDAVERFDGTDNYELVTDNAYCMSDYYFGVVLGSPLDLDSIDSICWHEYETGNIEEAFEEAFGDLSYAEHYRPQIYHFVRIC